MKLMVCIRVFKFMMILWLIFHKCKIHRNVHVINDEVFLGFGNERAAFHRCCSPAIRFTSLHSVFAPVGFN